MGAEQRLAELGIVLPAPPAPAGLYAPCVQTGPLLYVSGQIPTVDGAVTLRGKCGDGVSIDEGARLARQCALNGLAIARQHLGTLDRVTKVVRVAGYVASAPTFSEHPRVVNGASQLFIDVFGEAGRHARIAIGVAELPANVPVEVEFLFEVSRAT
jgi:enamine deaminase RidA (YjgF/YER057c/UK114 family)